MDFEDSKLTEDPLQPSLNTLESKDDKFNGLQFIKKEKLEEEEEDGKCFVVSGIIDDVQDDKNNILIKEEPVDKDESQDFPVIPSSSEVKNVYLS